MKSYYRVVDKQNPFVAYFDFPSLSEARAFMSQKALDEMTHQIWFVTERDNGVDTEVVSYEKIMKGLQ
jgi:ferritin